MESNNIRPACCHRQAEHGRTTIKNHLVIVWDCGLPQHNLCTEHDHGMATADGPISVCQGCNDYDGEAESCIHRGEFIRWDKCTICGSAAGRKGTLVPISICNGFEGSKECSPAHYTHAQKAKVCNRACPRFEVAARKAPATELL